tara:strand:- start:573 stop:3140 length:2568 start_codon:yes stop_codon:yes gene_type:complete
MSLVKANGAGDQSTGFYKQSIDQSLRFDDASNCRMSVVVGDGSGSGGGDRQKFTLSVWLKISKPGSAARIFEGYTSASQYTGLGFDSTDRMRFDRSQDGTTNTVYSNQVFRDVSNWYHFVWAIDTTQSSETNRVRMYVNGSELTSKGDAVDGYPSQNLNTIINLSGQSTQHAIGRFGGSTGANFDGYMAEMNFIDGTQLTPSSFGETKNGVWIPKSVSGLTYGTLGFRLTFADPSDLGNNANSTDGTNDFTTVSNLAATDVVSDSPTNNFPTMNAVNSNTNLNLSEGAMKIIPANTSDYYRAMSTMAVPTSGKWYWEVRLFVASYLYIFGLYDVNSPTNQRARTVAAATTSSTNDYQVRTSNSLGIDISTEGASFSDWLSTNIASGDIVSFAYDADNNKMWFGLNGTFQNTSGTANPATGDDPRFSSMASTQYYLGANMPNPASGGAMFNFGQDDTFAGAISSAGNTDANGAKFRYTPPTGYLALCNSNLPDTGFNADESDQPTSFHNAIIYDGDGNSTQDVTGVGFKPDWTFIKERTSDGSHIAQNVTLDSTRGYENFLVVSSNIAQSTGVSNGNSTRSNDGFQTTNSGVTNQNGQSYLALNWKINGGTTTTDTNGSQDSIIQTNQTIGMTIGLHEATSGTYTFAHGLGATPEFLMFRNIDSTDNWVYWHTGMGAAGQSLMYLNVSSARSASGGAWLSTLNSTLIGITTGQVSGTSGTHLFWAFRSIEGFSKFGNYEGNANADGTYIYTNFRPSVIWLKNYDTGNTGHLIFDDVRHEVTNSYPVAGNVRQKTLRTDGDGTTGAGGADTEDNSYKVDFLSNGFKLRTGDTNFINAGDTYVYWAWAHNPFKFGNAF